MPKQTFFNLDNEKRERIIDAAIDEFSTTSYDHANLQNIVRQSKIPRGSLYQYFDDKFDLYSYIFEIVKERKMTYLSELLENREDKPFLKLFEQLFVSGTKFALDNPRLVQVFSRLIADKGEVYERIMKDSLKLAKDYYVGYIEADQKKGRIRQDIDADVFAQLVIDLTLNVSIDEIQSEVSKIDFDHMYERITQIIQIIEHGVMTGE